MFLPWGLVCLRHLAQCTEEPPMIHLRLVMILSRKSRLGLVCGW